MSLAICPKRTVCRIYWLAFILCLFSGIALAGVGFSDLGLVETQSARAWDSGLDSWLSTEYLKSVRSMVANISLPGAQPGAVAASPSRSHPNYFYHWVRDGALVMDTVVSFYEKDPAYFQLLSDYVDFSLRIQGVPNLSGGLGEPKFNLDGTAYNEDWGRPQNDGPALRAITLTRLAQDLLNSKQSEEWVRTKLYDGVLPTRSVIKADLEYVANHWRESCFDLWEEVRGVHFYTRMVQRKALIYGAALADQLGDRGAAVWYRSQAKEMEAEIHKHWSPSRGYILETLDRMYGTVIKESGLDVAILLGAIQGGTDDGFYSITSDRVLSSVQHLKERFQQIYPINSSHPDLGTAIGRYPEDIYDGYAVREELQGNPWFLATCAYAELYYRLASAWTAQGYIQITPLNLAFFKSMIRSTRFRAKIAPDQTITKGTPEFDQLLKFAKAEGDRYLARVKFHAASDGSLGEQINRYTGFMQGAADLSWSYASLITAYWEREKLGF